MDTNTVKIHLEELKMVLLGRKNWGWVGGSLFVFISHLELLDLYVCLDWIKNHLFVWKNVVTNMKYIVICKTRTNESYSGNMYVMCSDNVNLIQQFFLLPLNFFNTKILIHNLAHTTSNLKCYFPPTSNSQIYISVYSPRSEVQVFKVVGTGSSTWYCKGGAWPPSVAQLFLNEEQREHMQKEGIVNCF